MFAETETRVVGRDYTVRWKNGFWQMPEAEARASGVRSGLRVVVERRLSGELRFRCGEQYFARLGASNAPGDPPRPERHGDRRALAWAGHGGSVPCRMRTEVETAEVEEDGGGEAVLVAEAATPGLDRLDAAVDATAATLSTGPSPDADAHCNQRSHVDFAQPRLLYPHNLDATQRLSASLA